MEIEGREPTAVDHALDAWATAQDHLIKLVEDGGLAVFDDLSLVGFLQRFEQLRNRTALVDHRAVRDAETRRLPDKVTQPNFAADLPASPPPDSTRPCCFGSRSLPGTPPRLCPSRASCISSSRRPPASRPRPSRTRA